MQRHSLRPKHCAKCFPGLSYFILITSCEVGSIMTLAFQMRKLRFSERVLYSRPQGPTPEFPLRNPLRPTLSFAFDKLENRLREVIQPELLFDTRLY